MPVVPAAVAVTVHVAVGEEPTGATPVTAGVVPPVLLVMSGVKLLVATLRTGSLNVTVQRSVVAFVGLESARAIEDTVGAVLSITQECDAGLLVRPCLSAAWTWNVCEPAESAVYVMPAFGQVVKAGAASSLQRKLVAPEALYVNVAEVAVVGLAGDDVIVGVDGPAAASAVHAAQPLSARIPSSASGFISLALFVVLWVPLPNIWTWSPRRLWVDGWIWRHGDGGAAPAAPPLVSAGATRRTGTAGR